jgi:type II secretory ATPase GspE/PulE/Tfp pilus assembly ATPase PilB-like protein
MAFADTDRPLARVIPIEPPKRGGWQGDLLTYLISNPRHMAWLTERPVIRHFVEEVLIARMVHDRAEEVALYHSPWRFEIDFKFEGRRHRVTVPQHRWALPIVLRLKQLAGMDVTNPVAWQIGEITVGGDVHVNAWVYPTARSERLVLRPRWAVRLGAVA